jgi:hypothetical protein
VGLAGWYSFLAKGGSTVLHNKSIHANSHFMKAFTVRLSEEDYEGLRKAAFAGRESVSGCAGRLLSAELTKLMREVKARSVKEAVHIAESQETKKPGVQVEINELGNFTSPAQKPTHTAEEAKVRVEEMKKEAERRAILKRLEAGHKDLVRKGSR